MDHPDFSNIAHLFQQPPDGGPIPQLAQAAAGQPPEQTDGGLEALQHVLNTFPALLGALEHPADVNQAATALKTLTGIQARLMGNSGPQAA